MKFDNQLRYAVNIIEKYNGSIPLSKWLKDYFRVNKQMGSNDRKTVSQMVYGFYRLGFNQYSTTEERTVAGMAASGQLPGVLEYFLSKGFAFHEADLEKIFPWSDRLSEGIDAMSFAKSFLVQPDLFLRMRPGFREAVIEKLDQSAINYSTCGDACVRMSNATKIDKILRLNTEAVVQDKNSQETGRMAEKIIDVKQGARVWDCCAASGGKSIMVFDTLKDVDLTVSDIRESILVNLQQRFAEAGIARYHALITDLTDANDPLPSPPFDLIIADVPCSGSGTWARTPEQLYFFKEEKISHYSQLQKKIVSRVIPLLKKGGALLYITCSVFRDENEEVIEHIVQNHSLSVEKKEIFSGYNDRADTLFAVLLRGR
jgi:16S rRNA (cytosine967-C5)-methyltransferase